MPAARPTTSSVSCAPAFVHATGSGRCWTSIRADVAVPSRFPRRKPGVAMSLSSFDLEVEEGRKQQEEQAHADDPSDWELHCLSLHRAGRWCAHISRMQP